MQFQLILCLIVVANGVDEKGSYTCGELIRDIEYEVHYLPNFADYNLRKMQFFHLKGYLSGWSMSCVSLKSMKNDLKQDFCLKASPKNADLSRKIKDTLELLDDRIQDYCSYYDQLKGLRSF